MTEYEWSHWDDPNPMLAFLRGPEPVPQLDVMEWLGLRRAPAYRPPPRPPSKRKLRLLACACCRRIEPLFPDRQCGQAIENSERFADGLATEQELAVAQTAAGATPEELIEGPVKDLRVRAWAKRAATDAASLERPEVAVPSAVSAALEAAAIHEPSFWTSRLGAKALADLMRDIFGPLLFRSLAVLPSWLSSPVVALAETAYEERIRPGGTLDNARLVVLADALEEAGCDNEEILTHLRDPEADHVRGCFALDLLLGRS